MNGVVHNYKTLPWRKWKGEEVNSTWSQIEVIESCRAVYKPLATPVDIPLLDRPQGCTESYTEVYNKYVTYLPVI